MPEWGITTGLNRVGPKRQLTATSTVFSWPTRLISEVHKHRVMTAAMKTKPLLLVALDAVIWAPSGDQLYRMVSVGKCCETSKHT